MLRWRPLPSAAAGILAYHGQKGDYVTYCLPEVVYTSPIFEDHVLKIYGPGTQPGKGMCYEQERD